MSGLHATGSLSPHASPEHEYDVVVIGYGPVGRLLAIKLGRRGYRVCVVERQREAYPLPRAVHMDDETARILASVHAGPADLPDAIEPYNDIYEWRSADRETLLRLDWSGRGPSGWNVSNFFHQPAVEVFLSGQVDDLPNVELMRGWTAVAHVEAGDAVTVELQTRIDERRAVSGKYVIGADGANSVVRNWLGSTMTDLGYFHEWLVIDLLPTVPMMVEPPAWQLCDPARPTTLVPGGPGRRRFEFMRLPGETVDELNDEKRAWELLEPWGVTAETAKLERHVVYTFQARWSNEWRRGRLLIAGDSAHLMPPFAGQGMCSGLRDVVNLEWKLHLVLSGVADEALLDTYGPERAEHLRHFIDASMALGEIICITDADKVAERDARMMRDLAEGVAPEPRPLPRLGPGVHRPDLGGGVLSIQAPVTGDGGGGLFDEVTGGGPSLLLRGDAQRAHLGAGAREILTRLGTQVVAFGPEPLDSGTVVDTTGDYGRWFDTLDADAVLVRPDFYVYGAVRRDQINKLVRHYAEDLSVRDVPW
jgi:2-polyprenyl-6-methoxyphenol hydroxylase-like FAD-dependent oxidoreductase